MKNLDPLRTCCIVTDMQKDFYSKGYFADLRGKEVSKMQDLVKPINEFINTLRDKGVKIVFTKYISGKQITPGNFQELAEANNIAYSCPLGSTGVEFGGFEPQGEDIIIEKGTFDPFAYTDLKERLESLNIENVLFCGVRTEVCIDAGAKRAALEGFRSLIIDDLVGTYDDKYDVHEYILEFFAKYYGYVIHSSEVLELLRFARD